MGELELSIKKALNYNLVKTIAGNNVAVMWGTETESLGYKEVEKIFNGKYKYIKLEEFKDEVIIAFYNEFTNKNKQKKKMKEILYNDYTDEGQRRLYNKKINQLKEVKEEIVATSVPKIIIDNTDKITDVVKTIDGIFYSILERCKNKEEDILTQEEASEILKKDADLRGLLKDSNFEFNENYIYNDILIDDFYEHILKKYNDIIKRNTFEDGEFNKETEELTRLFFEASENGKNYNALRKRGKETIFDRINKNTLEKTRLKDFIEVYEELITPYELDEEKLFTEYVVLEKNFNLICYIKIAYYIREYNMIDEELMRRISELTLLDNVIYRIDNIEDRIKALIYDSYKGISTYYDEEIKQADELLKIKYTIVKDLLDLRTLREIGADKETILNISQNLIGKNCKKKWFQETKEIMRINNSLIKKKDNRYIFYLKKLLNRNNNINKLRESFKYEFN